MSTVTPIISPLTDGTSTFGSPNFSSTAPQASLNAKAVGDERSPDAIAKEFDGVFLAMLLKNMRTSMSEEGLFGSDSSDTYGGIFDMFMSRHIAQGSPLGIGEMVKSYLDNNDQASNEYAAHTA